MNKASGCDGIPVELFQILKDDAVKVLHSICQEIWKTQQWPQDWKRSVFIPIPKNGNAKNVQTTTQLYSSHMLAKQCSKFSKPGFNRMCTKTSRCSSWIWKRQRNQRSNCQHTLDHWKSKRVSEKHLFLLYKLCQSLWLYGSRQTVENSERDGNTRPPYLPPKKSVCRSRSNS